MRNLSEQALLISGPIGVGKTSIAETISALLQVDNVPHTFIDLDALTYTYPRSVSDPFNSALALESLTSIWAHCRKRGSRNLVIARVVESASDVEDIANAIGVSRPILCRLTAPDQTLLKRIRNRNTGSNIPWQESRSLQLSAAMKDDGIEGFCIATEGRSMTEIATEISQLVTWSRE
ncbi:MAG: AAA family ATPase [Paracoccaceae bacterium]